MNIKIILSFILAAFLLSACGGGDTHSIADHSVQMVSADDAKIQEPDPSLRLITSEKDLWYFRISAYVDMVFSLPWPDKDRSIHIKEVARWNNVTSEQLAEATGYTIEDVEWYLTLGNGQPFRAFSPEENKLLSAIINPVNVKDVGVETEITITGQWLNLVKNIRFNGRIMQVTKRGLSSMMFVLDKNECGTLSAEMYEDDVISQFGFHGVTGQCSGEVVHVRAVQNLIETPSFINGKTLGIQAAVKSKKWPLDLIAQVEQNGEIVHEVKMTPPRFQDVTLENGSPYYAQIPGHFVKPGMKVKIVGYFDWNGGIPFFGSISPNVDYKAQTVKLTVVQFTTSDGITADVPSLDMLRDIIIKTLPLPDNVELTIIQGFLSKDMRQNTDWSTALVDIINVRHDVLWPRGDFSTIFYGFVPWRGTGILGIAYLNSVVALGVGLSVDKIDGSWARIFTHEMGHVLNRRHAPCGSVSGPDLNYPYAGGLFGPTPAFDVLTGYQHGLGMYDVMGYCGGSYFSDYNYSNVRQVAEARFAKSYETFSTAQGFMLPVYGFKIALDNGHINLLTSSTFNLGGGEYTTVTVDGEQRAAYIYTIDHSNAIHVWIEGDVGSNITISIDGIIYTHKI